MKKMLMLGSSSDSVERIEYAKSLGFHTITTDYFPPEKSPAKLVSDEYWMVSTAEVDCLERKCREEGITAIAEGGSEFNREIMMELTKRLNLPCYITPESCIYERDKSAFKQACRDVGMLVPKDYYVSPKLTDEELDRIEYPVMVKPVDMSGNRGVAYCYCPEDVKNAYAEVRSISDNPNTIIEKMIEGQLCAASYVMANGEIKYLHFEECFYVEEKPKNCYALINTKCDYSSRFLLELNEKVKRLLKRIGLKDGFGGIQFIKDADGVLYAIEMWWRLGGDSSHLAYPITQNFDVTHWLMNCALGVPNNITEVGALDREKWSVSYLLWTERAGTVSDVVGLDKIANIPNLFIDNQTCKGKREEQYTYPIRLCYVYDNVDEVVDLVRYINENVQLLDENGENMLFYYTDLDRLKEILQ